MCCSPFDATGLEGKSVVVFETLFQGETEIAGHEDIEDEGQTVNFVEEPKIGTTATVDGQHTADPTGEITIVDVVEYTGLIPGKTYTISGVLMDKATGEPLLLDGAIVTAEVEFTPESADGTVELTYTLDASALAGTTIVVFETLYSDGVEIAAHADINDEAQTVEITEPEKPTLGTTATVDGQHTADPVGEITIVDVVEYTGLIPGETYTVSGVLMDKATGNTLLVDGAEVTAEAEFTPRIRRWHRGAYLHLGCQCLGRHHHCGVLIPCIKMAWRLLPMPTSTMKTRLWRSRNRRSPPWAPPLPWTASIPPTPPVRSPLWMWYSTPASFPVTPTPFPVS